MRCSFRELKLFRPTPCETVETEAVVSGCVLFYFLFAGSFLTLTPAFISRQIGAACSTRTSGAKGDASSELITSPNGGGGGGGPQVAPVTNEGGRQTEARAN